MIQLLQNIDLIMKIIWIYFSICLFSGLGAWLYSAEYIEVPKKLDRIIKLLWGNVIGSFCVGVLYFIYCCIYVL